MSRHTGAIPVRVRGVDYPSMSAAAEALGVSRQAIHRAFWSDRLDVVGTGGRENYAAVRKTKEEIQRVRFENEALIRALKACVAAMPVPPAGQRGARHHAEKVLARYEGRK